MIIVSEKWQGFLDVDEFRRSRIVKEFLFFLTLLNEDSWNVFCRELNSEWSDVMQKKICYEMCS